MKSQQTQHAKMSEADLHLTTFFHLQITCLRHYSKLLTDIYFQNYSEHYLTNILNLYLILTHILQLLITKV